MNKFNSLLFQADVIALLPEVFLALTFLVILVYGSFQVVYATELYTYLTPLVSRLTLIVLVLSFILVLNNPIVNTVVWNGTFVLDYLSSWSKLFVLFSVFLCVLLAE